MNSKLYDKTLTDEELLTLAEEALDEIARYHELPLDNNENTDTENEGSDSEDIDNGN